MDAIDKENNNIQLFFSEEPGNSFVQKQSADFGGPVAASGLGSSEASVLNTNPWQQRPLAVATHLNQSSELQERRHQQMQQQHPNTAPVDQSVFLSQQSQQMSAHVQDMSIYTGLNSSQQMVSNPTPAAGFVPAAAQGGIAPATASAGWQPTTQGPFAVIQNQPWPQQTPHLQQAKSMSQTSSSTSKAQPALSSNGHQALLAGEPEAAEIVQYPKFLNSSKHPQRERESTRGRAISQNKQLTSSEGGAEPLYSFCFVWGNDKYGQLGQNQAKKVFQAPKACLFGLQGPQNMDFKIRLHKVSCGETHTAMLSCEGLLYMSGSTQGGKLGLPERNSQSEVRQPTLVEDLLPTQSQDVSGQPFNNKVIDVVCANSFTLAVTKSGHVFSWGTSVYGALGLGDSISSADKPTLIEHLVAQQGDIVKVDAKYNHSAFLTNSGKVFMAGKGDKGQLGMPPPQVQNVSQQQSFNKYALIPPSMSPSSVVGNLDSKTKTGGFCLYQPALIPSLSRFKIIDVRVGKDFSLFLTHTREVLACGANEQGQLGLGETQELHCEPVKIPVLANITKIDCNEGGIALDDEGRMYQWGPVSREKVLIAPQRVSNINQKIINCSIGKFCFSAIDSASMVWVWGDNKHAQLGLNDYTARSTPYPLLALKDKQIGSLEFGANHAIAFKNNQDPNSPGNDLLSCRNPASPTNANPNFVRVSGNTKSALSRLVDNFNPSGSKNLLLTPMFDSQQNSLQSMPEQHNFVFQASSCVQNQMQKQNIPQAQQPNGDRLLNQQPYLQSMHPDCQQDGLLANSQTQMNAQHACSQQAHRWNLEPAAQKQMSNQHLTSYMTPSNHIPGSDPSASLSAGLMNIQGDSQRSSTFQTHSVQPSQHNNMQQTAYQASFYAKPPLQHCNGALAASMGHHQDIYINNQARSQTTPATLEIEAALTSSQREQKAMPDGTFRSQGNTLHTYTNGGSNQSDIGKREDKALEDYEEQLRRFEEERARYQEEIEQLKVVNMEQREDLRTMIQSVSDLKESQMERESHARLKGFELEQAKQEHDREIFELKQKSASEINMQIEQIDFLTKKIEQLDEQFKGPKNECMQALEKKTEEINKLQAELSIKQKDVIGMQSEIERYKIQINALNQKLSDQEVELVEKRGAENALVNDAGFKKLQSEHDFTVNLNQCQKLTIEKLENRILILENEKNENAKQEQTAELEKAQLQRKVTSLENQLRFEKNLNEDTKKEIEKLDNEISQVATNCSNREQILQKKLEDQMELYRQEKVQSAALKSEMMQKDNQVEKLKAEIRQRQADTKLAKLETEALVKQCEYERQNMGKQVRDMRLGGLKSPRNQPAKVDTSAVNLGDSYIDMSYSQSPSLIQTQTRRNHSSTRPHRNIRAEEKYLPADAAKEQVRENASYNQQLLKSIQKKTIAPLISDYQTNLAHKQRAMELADKTAEQSLKLRGLHASAETRSPRKKSKTRNNRDDDDEEDGEDQEEFNMRNESQKYNQRVTQNINRLIVGNCDADPKALTYGPTYKRNKSADPFSAVGAVGANKVMCNRSNRSNSGSRNGQVEPKQPTYIQKLLGLNRTSSTSSSQYPFSIPPWQQLLKNKQEALGAQSISKNYAYDHQSTSKQLDSAQASLNTFKRRSSHTIPKEEIRGLPSKAVSNSYGFNEETVSVGDIGKINKEQQRSTIVFSEDGAREASGQHTDYADVHEQRTIFTEKH